MWGCGTIRRAGMLLCGLTATAVFAPAARAQDAEHLCAAIRDFSLPAGDIGLPSSGARVTAARAVKAFGPFAAYCEVKGAIAPVNAGSPSILFAIDLPEGWNGKTLMLGGGGYDGTVPDVAGPLLALPANQALPPLARGYVTFGSDSGHQATLGATPTTAVDGAFTVNEEALRNYSGDALKKTHDVAARIVLKAYGRAAARTYFAGGSNGGREALLVLQRWPGDFDGAIAAYPFWNAGTATMTFGRVMNGFAKPGAYPGPEKQALLFNSVVATCDGLDGIKDGLISNVEACRFDPLVLRCPTGGDESDGCLSDAQIAALRRYNEPVTYSYRTKGRENSYPGFPVFAGADLRGALQLGTTPPVHPATATMPTIAHFWDQLARYGIARDPAFNPSTLDPEAPGGFAARINKIVDDWDAREANLEAFRARGGKLIIYQGLADPIVSPRSTIAYWTRMRAEMGSKAVGEFARFYTVPGFGHGAGGLGAFNPGWDPLTVLEGWREGGIAPAQVTVTDLSPGGAGRSRPLCEYGTWPKFIGSGSPASADNFRCVAQ